MKYRIYLDGIEIGKTDLEKADAPMGAVWGKIYFTKIDSGYTLFKNICSKKGIDFEDFPEDKLITTRNIPGLVVKNQNEIEINGFGCYISGMDSDIFEINIEGIPYPFYEEEFPQHVKAYNNLFN